MSLIYFKGLYRFSKKIVPTKYIIKTNGKNCKDCKFFINGVVPLCKKTNFIYSNESGELAEYYLSTEFCRLNKNLCGPNAIYFR